MNKLLAAGLYLFLLYSFVYPYSEPESELFEAARFNYASILESLIKKGVNINARDELYRHKTPLMYAAENNAGESVKLLIKANAGLNDRDDNGFTALMYAALNGPRKEIAGSLIEAGADLNAKSKTGQTALNYAIQKNDAEIVKLLAEAKADVNTKMKRIDDFIWPVKEGTTPLIQASQKQYLNINIMKSLIDARADVDSKDCDGMTALMYAAENNNKDVILILLEAKADAQTKDSKGRTAEELAIHKDIKYLLSRYNELKLYSKKTDGKDWKEWFGMNAGEYAGIGYFDKAFDYYVKSGLTDAEASKMLGDALFSKNSYEAAAKYYDKAGDKDGLKKIAEAYYKNADYDKAIIYYEKIGNSGDIIREIRKHIIGVVIEKKSDRGKMVTFYEYNSLNSSEVTGQHSVFQETFSYDPLPDIKKLLKEKAGIAAVETNGKEVDYDYTLKVSYSEKTDKNYKTRHYIGFSLINKTGKEIFKIKPGPKGVDAGNKLKDSPVMISLTEKIKKSVQK